MQLEFNFQPTFAVKLPPLMQQMHVNKVRHLIANRDIELVGRTRLELGKARILWISTGQTELIEVTKNLNC